ncbi:MAG: Unknown protein [uncultured Thiotrichaceae bacterium]|uniref:Uncharacterized protein n=1 Tax=uncultured Thiotrichaceae bacterium TaxID=298394 RepID=A0A6S6S8M8_9GAMM|nr:MAG: Unknown protein [uncultured Thiotrichaceae bacterium]
MSTSPIALDMGMSIKVFDDTLPNASIPYSIKKVANGYQLTHESRSIAITLKEMPPRVIAGLTLPVTHVELDFSEHTEEEIERYMLRFKRYFHRGGG